MVLTSNTGWYLYNFRVNLINRLADRGYKVHLIAPTDKYLIELEKNGFNTHHINIDNKGQNVIKDLKTVFQYTRILREINPDIIFGFTIKPIIYCGFAAAFLKIPIINTVTGLGTAFIAGGFLQHIAIILYKLSQRNTDTIVFQNRSDKEFFLRKRIGIGVPATIIPGSGVDVTRFNVRPLKTKDKKKFLFIGRFLTDKGVREFINAANIIHSNKFKDVEFQLVGEVTQKNRTSINVSELQEWGKLSFVQIFDWRTDVRPLIEDACCIVLPSYREGLPRTLIEAGAMGRPVIATAVAGCKDVVVDGVTGLLCQPKSSEDLAEKIKIFLNYNSSELEVMCVKARRRVEEEFSQDIILAKYEEILRNLI